MTPIQMCFVTPLGDPIVGATVEITPTRPSFNEEDSGIVLPKSVSATTDSLGQCTVSLWPSQVPYLVRCRDTVSEAEIFYRFVVPDSVTPVRLQDTLIENGEGFNGAYFELVSDTVLRIRARGKDGVMRRVDLNLIPE